MPMRKNHHQLYLYQQEQTLPRPGNLAYISAATQVNAAGKFSRVLSVQHGQHLSPVTSVWIWSHKHPWSGKHLVKETPHAQIRSQQGPSAPAQSLQQQNGVEALTLRVLRSLWMPPQKTGWGLHFPGKEHCKLKGQPNWSFSRIRTLRKSENLGQWTSFNMKTHFKQQIETEGLFFKYDFSRFPVLF